MIWSDYFKPEHLEANPDLHTKVWNLLKLAGKNKQNVDAEAAAQLGRRQGVHRHLLVDEEVGADPGARLDDASVADSSARIRGPWRAAVVEGSMRPAVEPGDWLLTDPTGGRWPRRGIDRRHPRAGDGGARAQAGGGGRASGARTSSVTDPATGDDVSVSIRLGPDEAWLLGDDPGVSIDSRATARSPGAARRAGMVPLRARCGASGCSPVRRVRSGPRMTAIRRRRRPRRRPSRARRPGSPRRTAPAPRATGPSGSGSDDPVQPQRRERAE